MKLTTVWDWFWWVVLWLALGFFSAYEITQYVAWWLHWG